MRRRFLALVLLAASPLAAPAPGRPQVDDGELLVPGPPVERAMAAGERHLYRVEVKEDPVLVTVDQRSLDVVLEVRGPAGEELRIGGTGGRWGPEVLLLAGAGERRIEVRPMRKAVWPGRYRIAVETLSDPSTEGNARRRAFALMSRAGQESFPETPEAWKQAAISYREALAIWRQLKDRRWEAETVSCLALLEYRAHELHPAIADYEPAMAIWRELGEPRREALTLNDLGLTRLFSGDNSGAREALDRSVSLWKQTGDRFDEAEARSNLCFLEQRVGALSEALTCYENPRAVFQEAGIQSEEQRILNNLGGIYDLLGEPDAALAHYQQSLELLRAQGDLRGEANALNNIAVIHRTLGEWQEALRLYGQAREVVERIGERSLEASLRLNVGSAYSSLGEPQRAVTLLEEALKMYREIGEGRSVVITLNTLGTAWRRLGELGKALDHHRQALALADSMSDLRQGAVARSLLADAQLEKGDPVAALSTLAPALAYLKDSGLRIRETQALHTQARALTLAGRARDALPILQEVLTRRRTLRDGAGEAEALTSLAVAERSLGLQAEARAHAEAAVARVEELRTGFVSPDLRASFLATQRSAYSLLIELLMDRHAAEPAGHWDLAALEVSEQARARSLLDALQADRAARGASPVPTELLERRKSLRRRLSAKVYQQLGRDSARAAALGQEIESVLAELDSVAAEIGRLDPQAAALRRPQPIGANEIAGLLDDKTLLLEYALGKERSFLWMVGRGAVRSFTLPSQRHIEALARQVYDELSTVEAGAAGRGKAAASLGRILLGPVWKHAARARRLVIVADAALHYVPFSALPAPDPGRQPLLEHAEVVYIPSATTLALERQRLDRRAPAAKWAAILADPVFAASDPRLHAKATTARRAAGKEVLRGRESAAVLPAFERLPSSRREAERIAGLAPAKPVWKLLDLDASRESVLSGELGAYRFVHFATHGITNARNPELSGLALSQVDAAGRPREGFLGLPDIYELDLGADLVVLSGCRTALGREVRGEGLMGLTRGFLYAGVPRVVASLWAAQDRATAELMTRFYRAMWRGGLAPAAALRQAQISLRRDPRYRGSNSWAGFVLQGEWR
jgi:CHAT domain-containing protein/tetratricopeptide (TPR) repeat protein